MAAGGRQSGDSSAFRAVELPAKEEHPHPVCVTETADSPEMWPAPIEVVLEQVEDNSRVHRHPVGRAASAVIFLVSSRGPTAAIPC